MRQLCLENPVTKEFAPELLILDSVASGTSVSIPIPAGEKILMTCVYTNDDGASISAGVVTLESAENGAYSGTWNSEGTSNAAANTTDSVEVEKHENWWRARITTPIVGGKVKVYLKAYGAY